jgi:RNA polymerase sigma-70 factor (ECF subfamily)
VNSKEKTFIDLYEMHYDEVHAFCARRVGWDTAADATAEVFAVAWRRIDDVPADTSRAWLYGVARRVVGNAWRSTSRRKRLADRVGGQASRTPEGPEAVVVQRSVDDEVLRALAKLRAPDQEILRLSAWEELTGPEIAEVLGISLNAVQQRLTRARRRLAKAIGTRTLAREVTQEQAS